MPAGSNLVSLTSLTHRYREQVPMFALEQLEEDVVGEFIAGKPLIKSESLLRTVFKFKKEKLEMFGSSAE